MTATATETANPNRINNLRDWLARVCLRGEQLWCGLRGHENLLHFDGRRVCLKCASCQRETLGWEV